MMNLTRWHRWPAALMIVLLALPGAITTKVGATPKTPTSETSGSGGVDIAADLAGTSEAPPTTGPAVVKDANLWIVICATASVGCLAPAEAAREAGQKLGWKVTIADGNYGIGDGINNAISQAIGARATAIALIGIDCRAATGGLEAAVAAGIPVVGGFSFDCQDKPLFTANMLLTSKYPKVEDWLRANGAARARWLIHATQGKAKIIESKLIDNPAGLLPHEGFVAELADKCRACEIMNTIEVSGPDLVSGAYAQQFAGALTASPQANSAAFQFDTYILVGNIPAAIAGAGRDMVVAGGEGLVPVLGMLGAREVGAVLAWDTGWQGYGLVDTVNRVLAGEKPVPEGLGWQLLESLSKLPPPGKPYATGIDYKTSYLTVWGVK